VTSCTHCGGPIGKEPVRTADVDGAFCCLHCLERHQPQDNDAADAIDTTDLFSEQDAASAPQETDENTAYFSVNGMHCTTCEEFIETTATETDGIIAARASYATDMVRLTYDPAVIEQSALPDVLSTLGYHASEPTETDGNAAQNRLVFNRLRLVFGALAAMVVMMFYLIFIYPVYLGIYSQTFLYQASTSLIIFVPVTFFSAVVLFGLGFPILRGAYVSLRARQPNMDLLIALATLTAYGYSFVAGFLLKTPHVYFDVSTMIIVIVSAGNHVEAKLKRKALGNLTQLTESRVTKARHLRGDGTTETVDIEACEPGDHVLVKSGERVPVDGEIIEGNAAVNEALITGESMPRSKAVGDAVIGGSIVTDSALVIEVGDDAASTLDRLMELLWNVQSGDAGAQRLADRVASVFVPVVIVLAVATALGWLLTGASLGMAILTGVSVLVISCPCSLGLATPLAIVSGVRAASEQQVVLLTPTILEQITETDIIAFDKTGTLTTGQMAIDHVSAAEPDTVLSRAAAVESRSSHPIATVITEAADASHLSVTAFEQHAQGVSATIDGERVTVGHQSLFSPPEWTVPTSVSQAVEDARQAGTVPTVVGWNGEARGMIAVSDTPREDWDEVITQLATEDCRVVVITGDDEEMARRFEDHPGIDSVLASVLPEEKQTVVGQLCGTGMTTMVGDGTNDAPALAQADLGIAMANGTELAMDAADAVVTTDRLAPIPTIFDIARGARRRLHQNLGWALCYNIVAIPLAMAGLINPLIAALAMGASSLIVVTNSARRLTN
jgi:Cu2+-exporting ATPase